MEIKNSKNMCIYNIMAFPQLMNERKKKYYLKFIRGGATSSTMYKTVFLPYRQDNKPTLDSNSKIFNHEIMESKESINQFFKKSDEYNYIHNINYMYYPIDDNISSLKNTYHHNQDYFNKKLQNQIVCYTPFFISKVDT